MTAFGKVTHLPVGRGRQGGVGGGSGRRISRSVPGAVLAYPVFSRIRVEREHEDGGVFGVFVTVSGRERPDVIYIQLAFASPVGSSDSCPNVVVGRCGGGNDSEPNVSLGFEARLDFPIPFAGGMRTDRTYGRNRSVGFGKRRSARVERESVDGHARIPRGAYEGRNFRFRFGLGFRSRGLDRYGNRFSFYDEVRKVLRGPRMRTEQSGNVTGRNFGFGKISGDDGQFRTRNDRGGLKKGNRSRRSARFGDMEIRRSYHRGSRIVRRGRFGSEAPPRRSAGDFEFIGIEPKLYEIRTPRGIIRSRRVPLASGKGDTRSVDVRERSGEGVCGIVDNVIPWRITRNRRFGGDSRLYRPDVRFNGGVARVVGISGERYESDGRENGEYDYHDDELRERESRFQTLRSHVLGNGFVHMPIG